METLIKLDSVVNYVSIGGPQELICDIEFKLTVGVRRLVAGGVFSAIDELESRAVGVAKIGERPIDRAAAAIFLKKISMPFARKEHSVDYIGGIDHEGMVHSIRHFEWRLVDWRLTFNQQHETPPASRNVILLLGRADKNLQPMISV